MNSRRLFFLVTGRLPQRRPRRTWSPRKPARNWKYRAWIRSLPSAVSGELGCEACHTGSDGGTAMKASDYSCVPLTHDEHMRLHGLGRAQFEALHDIDISALVKRLNHDWFAYSKEVK